MIKVYGLFMMLSVLLINNSCKNEYFASIGKQKFHYIDNLERQFVKINESDILPISTQISKHYLFNLACFSNEKKSLYIEDDWIFNFAFIKVGEESIFVPHRVSNRGEFFSPLNLEISNNYSLDLVFKEDGTHLFEMEMCYFFRKMENKTVNQNGKITINKGNNSHAKEIYEIMQQRDSFQKDTVLNIRNKALTSQKEICRVIRFYQKEETVIFQEVSTTNIQEPIFNHFDSISISEGGNLLNALEIEKDIWFDNQRVYD